MAFHSVISKYTRTHTGNGFCHYSRASSAVVIYDVETDFSYGLLQAASP